MAYLKGVLWGLIGAVLAAVVMLLLLLVLNLRVSVGEGSGGMAVVVSEGPVAIGALVGFVAGFFRGVRRSRPRVGLRA